MYLFWRLLGFAEQFIFLFFTRQFAGNVKMNCDNGCRQELDELEQKLQELKIESCENVEEISHKESSKLPSSKEAAHAKLRGEQISSFIMHRTLPMTA